MAHEGASAAGADRRAALPSASPAGADRRAARPPSGSRIRVLPEDVAKVVAAFIRGDMAYSTGQVVHVDGGMQIQRL